MTNYLQNKISVLIIDDEQLARKRIKRLLEKESDFSVIGECKNGEEAVEAIKQNSPDLIFLDVQMPVRNGFETLARLDKNSLPVIVFVTAYDKYALKAFDFHAVDYLLKPFDDDRFCEALEHAKKLICNKAKHDSFNHSVMNILDDIKNNISKVQPPPSRQPQETGYLERIFIKSSGRIFFVKTNNIESITAAGKYLELRVQNEKHLIRQTMQNVEALLNPKQFLRIHRSTIINIDCIKEIQPWNKSRYFIKLKNGESYISGNNYFKELQSIINQF